MGITEDVDGGRPEDLRGERKLDLPSGGWILLRDPKTLRRKDRQRLLSRLSADTAPGTELSQFSAGMRMIDGLELMMIVEWSIPYLDDPNAAPTAELLDELYLDDAAVLTEACEPVMTIITPRGASPAGMAVPGSPTRPASV